MITTRCTHCEATTTVAGLPDVVRVEYDCGQHGNPARVEVHSRSSKTPAAQVRMALNKPPE